MAVLIEQGLVVKEIGQLAGSWAFNDQEQLILQFDDVITSPTVSFAIHFNYTLKQGLSGFYRSSYKCKATPDAKSSQLSFLLVCEYGSLAFLVSVYPERNFGPNHWQFREGNRML